MGGGFYLYAGGCPSRRGSHVPRGHCLVMKERIEMRGESVVKYSHIIIRKVVVLRKEMLLLSINSWILVKVL